MNPFGLIARADRGGLASQTWELFRQLGPVRVLLVDMGDKGRGPTDPTLYESAKELRVTSGFPDRADAEWLTRPGVDSVFSVEGLYGEAMRAALETSGLKVVLQPNPELYRPGDLHGVDLVLVPPTEWELGRFPEGTKVLPVPVNTHDLYPVPRVADSPTRLLHVAGAAMADRNGTRDVISAARLLTVPCVLGVANRDDLPHRKLGRVRLEPLPEQPTYLGQWLERRADVLVLPRRYGGLSLPLQEAAACGIPIVTTHLPPQDAWVPAAGLVPVKNAPSMVHMKGGQFPVHSVDAKKLARVIDRFVADPQLRTEAGNAARAYAESLAWERWRDPYLNLLLG